MSAVIKLGEDFVEDGTVGLIGISLFCNGGGGSGLFVVDLRVNEECLEMRPGFVGFGSLPPGFNIGGEDVCVHDDDDAHVDELFVGFWGSFWGSLCYRRLH